MNKNLIAFRKNIITADLCTTINEDNVDLIHDFQHMLMSHGYMLTEKAYNNLKYASNQSITNLINDINGYFIKNIGNKDSKSLKQLFDTYKDSAEYLKELRLKKFENFFTDENIYNIMLNYCNIIWNKSDEDIDVKDIPQIYETVEFKFIDFSNEIEFKKIFTNLVKIGTALTPVDFKIIEWFALEYGNNNLMPSSIPFKENLCMLASLGLNVPVSTSTDVLRIATYMSDKTTDLILPKKIIRENSFSKKLIKNPNRIKSQFKKFSRNERRYLLDLLETVVDVKEMSLKRSRWIKLGEILHPGEYSTKFPKTFKAFHALRNTKVKSWYSDVETEFKQSIKNGLIKLSERPGEFSRRIDSLLRKYVDDTDLILSIFETIGDRISNKVLWELYSHFENRSENTERKIVIKGERKATILPTIEKMDDEIISLVQKSILTMITTRFSKLENMGNVYIDEELKKIPIPTNMRTLQDSTRVIIRGTRMPLQRNKKVLRVYIHWTDGVDLDISMNLIDNKGNAIVCNFSNLNPHSSIIHSGDVIPKIKGEWAEYIDIDLDKNPYQYGLVTVRNYSGKSLKDVDSVVGFMERDTLVSSKTWKPDTITNSIRVSSDGSNVNLFIIDFENNEWILIDEDVDGIPIEFKTNILKYIETLSSEPKLSVYDVLSMHTMARGNQVFEKTDDCDIIFNFNDFSTSYEKISDYMF